jgi:hypothetical protein
MHRLSPLLLNRNRFVLLAVLLAIVGLALVVPGPQAASACAGTAVDTQYYSDASHTTEVGDCYRDCSCNVTCWGTRTSFIVRDFYCCQYNGC